MEIIVTPHKRCHVVKVIGRIDQDTVSDLEPPFKTLTDGGHYNLVLDMSDVSFVSSKGWWFLIGLQKTCQRFHRGELILAGTAERIKNSLRIVGMDEYFRMFEDVTAAVGSF